jgi:hypothetical protein
MNQQRTHYKQAPRSMPTASAILQDGSIVELVYSDRSPQTALAVWKDGTCRREASVSVDE